MGDHFTLDLLTCLAYNSNQGIDARLFGTTQTLVERWQAEVHGFHVPFGDVAITLQDVEVLVGLKLRLMGLYSLAKTSVHVMNGLRIVTEPDEEATATPSRSGMQYDDIGSSYHHITDIAPSLQPMWAIVSWTAHVGSSIVDFLCGMSTEKAVSTDSPFECNLPNGVESDSLVVCNASSSCFDGDHDDIPDGCNPSAGGGGTSTDANADDSSIQVLYV
nr:serine/threonine-protein phosphatase 7 long form homolog [Ipomoea batatas]